MAGNGFQASSYANDRPPSSTGSGEGDISADPASSGFFTTDYKKHDDLKTMLDSNKDSLKLEAMKRIIGMVAKGKDASDLFPPVVKNVVSKNLEVKKLVYVYLTRYAEEQQDLALLSISTFQRALKDPNQLIRASALRVLSSIRVPVITPIMMLAIKEAVMDMSPYVRKTAAHAIPKLYSLDPETKEQLIEVLDRLLADKTTLVAGSAIQAFVEICPERIDLIHKNYRKLCNLLVDVEEWGQVVILNMLTHYCRTQFVSPNQDGSEEAEQPFYESSGKDSDDEDDDDDDDHADGEKKKKPEKPAPYVMDHDHRLLLRQSKPLLNSRNAAVVMAVAQLYHHCAPKSEVGVVVKSLIRLLRSHKEIQYVVLSNIATMTDKRKSMFEPYLKSFYVRSSDPLHVKLLKLEILTSLATETNISTILREFQTYVTSSDKDFAAATIQAIGRCASSIAEVTDTCLNGLVRLMSNRDEAVVAESVVVIKKLLQMRPSEHKGIICHMAKMVDKITVPMARASILWLIGEYSERVPKIAPDVLRRMAKNFINEEDIVKLQILNLAVKLCITNPKQTKLLCQYVMNLAKYDQNYDIRDRSRFLRQFVLATDKPCALAKYAKKIFLATKPAPVLESLTKAHDNYQLGSLSHLLNMKTTGYQELPEWPAEAPDASVRNVELPPVWKEEREPIRGKKSKQKQPSTDLKSFYSSSSEDDDDDEDEDEDDEDDSSEEDSEDESAEDKDASEESDDEEEEEKASSDSSEDSSEDTSDESEEDSSEEDSSDEYSEKEVKKPVKVAPVEEKPKKSKSKGESKPSSSGGGGGGDLLLDLDDLGPSLPVPAAPSTTALGAADLLTPTAASSGQASPTDIPQSAQTNIVQGISIPPKEHELLNRLSTGGLTVTYKYTRTISIFSPKMVSLELSFTNAGDKPFSAIKIGDKKIQSGMEIHDFPEIASLGVGSSSTALMGINFNDTTQAAGFQISSEQGSFSVSISAPVGELMQPHTMGETEFKSQQGKLGGMNENKETVAIPEARVTPEGICRCVRTVGNLLQVPSSQSDVYFFAAQTLATSTLVLVSVKVQSKSSKVTVNCEKMVIGTMLTKDLKRALTSAAES